MKSVCILSPDVGTRKKLADELRSIYNDQISISQLDNVKTLIERAKSSEITIVISSFFDINMDAVINASLVLQKIKPGLKIIVFHDRSDARFNAKCAQNKYNGVHEECLEKKDWPAIIQVAVDNLSTPEKVTNKRPPSP